MLNKTDGDKKEESSTVDKVDPVIDISAIRFAWSQAVPAVLEIDRFQVEKGEMLFVMGASGSGKSTLLSLMTGINLPQQGEVMVLDRDISQMGGAARDRFRADNIGYIFQMFNLIPYLSIVENVLLPCQFSSQRKERALQKSSSLKQEAMRLLEQLNLGSTDLLDKPVIELSVGQQQRVAAARALIGSPEIVIADEPTSSLDTEHRESFLQLLFEECSRSGASLVFVSHDTAIAQFFDRTVYFKDINKANCAQGEENR